MCCCFFLMQHGFFRSSTVNFPNVHEAFHLLAAPTEPHDSFYRCHDAILQCKVWSICMSQQVFFIFFFYILLQPCHNTLSVSPNTVETSIARPSHHLTEMHRLHICSPFMEELSKVTLHAETQTRLIYFLNLWQLAQKGKFYSTLISRRLNKQRQSFLFLLVVTQKRLLEVIWQSRRISCPD